MSRTNKDRPSRLRYAKYDVDYIRYPETEDKYAFTIKGKTSLPKKRKEVDDEWHWMRGTPSWWNNLFHTRPIRGKFHRFVSKVLKSEIEAISDMLEPSDSRRPHQYYW